MNNQEQVENENEKTYKSKQCVRDAMKRYKDKLKTQEPEKYLKLLTYNRAYNKEYYRKFKEDRAKLHELLQKMSTENS
jgi:hypothetical protein